LTDLQTSELPQLNFVFFARQALVNSSTGNPSFIEVFSELRPPAFPFGIGDFFVCMLMTPPSRPILVTTHFTADWSEQALAIGSLVLQVPTRPLVGDVGFFFAGIVVPPLLLAQPGNLTLQITFDGTEVRRLTIPVLLNTASSPAP
jgi:hypothetical protein